MNITLEHELGAIGRAAWDALVAADEQASAMQGWAWQVAWWETFRREPGFTREAWLVAARDAGTLVGLAPFFLERRDSDGRGTLRFIGDGMLGAEGILCARDAAGLCTAILDFAAEREAWSAMELSHLERGTPTAAALRELATRRGWRDQWSSRPSVHVTSIVASAHDEAGNDASAPCVELTEDPAQIEALLPTLFGLHIQDSVARGERSVFVDRRHRDLVRRFVRSGDAARVGLASLASEGRVVACALLGAVGSRMSALVSGVDPLAPHDARRQLAEATHECASLRLTRSATPDATTRVRRLATHSAPARVIRTVADEAWRLTRVLFRGAAIVAGRRQRAAAIASHRAFYDADATTALYRRQTSLQPPERTILTELRPMLRDARILDVGVGAGRTLPYFATLGREYHAFDYAQQMVEHCRASSDDLVQPSQIVCDDARQMRSAADAAFDFVLISYNGIDSVGAEEDRLRVLAEVRRVAAAGALFCFSSHNLQSVTPAGGTGVLERMRRWRRYLMFRAANPGLATLRRQPSAMLFDVGSEYAFAHYYITPHAQARQLESLGYRDVRVFSVESGREVTDRAQWTQLLDSWVYYLCRV